MAALHSHLKPVSWCESAVLLISYSLRQVARGESAWLGASTDAKHAHYVVGDIVPMRVIVAYSPRKRICCLGSNISRVKTVGIQRREREQAFPESFQGSAYQLTQPRPPTHASGLLTYTSGTKFGFQDSDKSVL
jgi:hypothetical protein